MNHLQGQQVEGVEDQNLFPALHGAEEIAVDPGPKCPDVAALAFTGRLPEGFGGDHAGQHLAVDAGLHDLRQHGGLEDMAQDKVGMRL